jgi:hypothetical protein
LMKPMFATAAGLLLMARSNGRSSNGRPRRWIKLRSRVSDWVRDFF